MARVLLVLGILLLAAPAASAVAADRLTPARGDPRNQPSVEAAGLRIADLTLQPEPVTIDAAGTEQSTDAAAAPDTVSAGDETFDSRMVDIDTTLNQLPSVAERVPNPPDAGLGLGLSLLLATSIVGYGVVFAIGMTRFASAAATHR